MMTHPWMEPAEVVAVAGTTPVLSTMLPGRTTGKGAYSVSHSTLLADVGEFQ